MPASNYISRPLAGAQINWGHPLTNGLISCHLMNNGAGSQDLVSGKLAVWQAPTVANETRGTLQYYPDGNSGKYLAFGDLTANRGVSGIAGNPFTLSAGSSFISPGGGGMVMGLNKTEGANKSPFFRYSAATTLHVSLHTTLFTATIPTVANNRYSAVSMVLPSTGIMEGWEGGLLVGTLATAILKYDGVDTILFLGGSSAIAGGSGQAIHYSYIHNRALSADQIRWLTAEPYCFFQSPAARKYYFLNLGNPEIESITPYNYRIAVRPNMPIAYISNFNRWSTNPTEGSTKQSPGT